MVLAALIALLYGLVWASVAAGGAEASWTPKLGLDLEGGTSITLQPRAAEAASGKVTKDNVDRAVEIIRRRVDARGIGEAEVTAQGSGNDRNIVISIPGRNEDLLAVVKQTAELRFRQVLINAPAGAQPQPTATGTASPRPTGTARPTATPSRPAATTPRPTASTNGRAVPAVAPRLVATPTPTPPASSPPASPAPTGAPDPATAAAQIPEQIQQQFATYDCEQKSNTLDVPEQYLVTCDDEGTSKYILAPAALVGTDVKTATSGLETNNQGQTVAGSWQVQLEFTGDGRKKFANITRDVVNLQPPQNQVAIVLDGVVISDPEIREAIPGGTAQITGGFTQKTSGELASNLRYGALPLAFDAGEELNISPTLGSSQLRGGLLAGAIGLTLVVLYSLLYYRGLGLVTVASLLVAGVVTYAFVSLFSNYLGLRLSLAGVAGLIVAIGITADSFVVYFERLRDEVREGRTLRVAVENAWVRARRTILAADFVSLLAAAVLYVLAVGGVKGFAFMLGLTTLIDIVVVFLFTKPLVAVLARTAFFNSGSKWSGLSRERLGVTQKPASTPIARRRPAAAKEA